MSVRNLKWILLCAGTLVGCSDTGKKYRNTENLERPPEIEITAEGMSTQQQSGSVTTTESINKGLDEQVHLDKTPGASTLVISRPFDQAWFILGVLLNQLELDITDRNRDQGYFYVKYDPDIDYAKHPGFWDGVLSMFGDDRYAERTYSLKLVESFGETEVTAGLAPAATGKETEKQADAAKDGPDRLLQTLFETLRDGMKEQARSNRNE